MYQSPHCIGGSGEIDLLQLGDHPLVDMGRIPSSWHRLRFLGGAREVSVGFLRGAGFRGRTRYCKSLSLRRNETYANEGDGRGF
jgi:hypothetical protein